MAIPPFQQGYPPDGSSLGQTKTTIRGNLDGTFLTLAVDHINNNNQPSRPAGTAGYHNIIHMVQNTTPSAIGGIGQLFTKAITNAFGTDEALFYLTGGNKLQQLTLNITPTASQNGYTFLPGGLIMQWGFNSSTSMSSSGVNTLLPIAFPNNFFISQVTLSVNANTGHAGGTIYTEIIDNQNFKIFQQNLASSADGFFWTAIGN